MRPGDNTLSPGYYLSVSFFISPKQITMKKLILFIAGVVCLAASLSAQSPPEIKPLNIGDVVPDITIDHIVNYKTASVRLSDFKGKLLILDFFSTYCGPCIAALPKMNNLQQKFGNSIQIFVVDDEPAAKVLSFLKTNHTGKIVSLPFITSDTILSKLFPHIMVPHEVFINTDGKFIAPTYADQVNVENVKELLAGKDVHLRIKEDVMKFSMQDLLFFNKDVKVERSALKSYSILSGFIGGIGSGSFVKRDSEKLITRICFTNSPVKQLYQFAYNIDFAENRLVYNVHNPSAVHFGGGNFDDWAIHYAYCYELLTPPETIEKVRRRMANDLKNYFDYKVGIVKRKMRCLVLQANENAKEAISKGGSSKHNFGNNNEPKYILNQSVSELTDFLNGNLLLPVLNETNFTQPVDMKLPDDILNIDSLKTDLNRYGFDLKIAEREMNVFEISDK